MSEGNGMAYVMIYFTLRDSLAFLSREEKGDLFDAILAYAEDGDEPDLTGAAGVAFNFMRHQIDRDKESYIERCRTNKENGSLGGRPRKDGKPKNRSVISEKKHREKRGNTEENDKNRTVFEGLENIGFDGLSKTEKTQYKDKSKEKEKDESKEEAEYPDPVAVYVTNNLSAMTYGNFEDLRAFREDFPDEVITHAVDVAVGNGVRSWSYVRAILSRYIRDGVKTLGDVKAQEEKREQKKQTAPTGSARPANNPALNYATSNIDYSIFDKNFFVDLDGKEQNA